jgi:hypothetical protein
VQKEVIGPATKKGQRSLPFRFEWRKVFRQRQETLPYRDVASVIDPTVVPSYTELPDVQAMALTQVVDVAVELAEDDQKEKAQRTASETAIGLPAMTLSEPVLKQIAFRVEKEFGKVVALCWNGPQRYKVNGWSNEVELTVVYQAPLSQMFSLQGCVGEKVIGQFRLLELGRFCNLLVKGDVRIIEMLWLKEGLVEVKQKAVWEQLVALQSLIWSNPSSKERLKRQMLQRLVGREGIKGVLSEKPVSSRKRRMGMERIIFQLEQMFADNKLVVELDEAQRLLVEQRSEEGLEATKTRVEKIVMEAKKGDKDKGEQEEVDTRNLGDVVGQLLLQLRLKDHAGPEAELDWRGELPDRLASVCPWPILALKRRRDADKNPQLVGVFAGDLKLMLEDEPARAAGDRGLPLCVRGDGYVLYEAGRFCELLVWGNPFVLEIAVLGSVGGEILHTAPLWKTIEEGAFSLGQLLTARMVAQVMTAVQGQLKALLQGDVPVTEEMVNLAKLLHAVRKEVVSIVGPSETPDTFNEWQFFRDPIPELDLEEKKEKEVDVEQKKGGEVAEGAEEDEEEEEEPNTPRPSRHRTAEMIGAESKETAAAGGGERDEITASVPTSDQLALDQTNLREVLEELDELRSKWNAPGVLKHPMEVQAALNDWLLKLRMASI